MPTKEQREAAMSADARLIEWEKRLSDCYCSDAGYPANYDEKNVRQVLSEIIAESRKDGVEGVEEVTVEELRQMLRATEDFNPAGLTPNEVCAMFSVKGLRIVKKKD